MNKKGFTLVEIIASIVIMGLISILLITTIQASVAKVKESNYENLKKMIIETTINYINNGSDDNYKLDDIKPEGVICEKNNKFACANEYILRDILDKNIYHTDTRNANDELTVINPVTNEGMREKRIIIYYNVETHSLEGTFIEDKDI